MTVISKVYELDIGSIKAKATELNKVDQGPILLPCVKTVTSLVTEYIDDTNDPYAIVRQERAVEYTKTDVTQFDLLVPPLAEQQVQLEHLEQQDRDTLSSPTKWLIKGKRYENKEALLNQNKESSDYKELVHQVFATCLNGKAEIVRIFTNHPDAYDRSLTTRIHFI